MARIRTKASALATSLTLVVAGLAGWMVPQLPAQAVTCPTSSVAASAYSQGTVSPTYTETLVGGGTAYVFCLNGSTARSFRTPTGFDPLTATDDQLRTYGFPPRPSDSKSLSEWQSVMEAWEPMTGTPSLTVTDAQAAIISNPIWSGWIAEPVDTFVSVQGNFTQPSYHSSSCSSSRLVSWVGMGGLHSASLLQAGTQIKSNGPTYQAWYEYLGPNGSGINLTIMNDVTVTPADPIHLFVSYQTANNIATFYVEDQTTHTNQSVVLTLGGECYDGSTAEWIDERPSVNGSPTNLTKYVSNDWYFAKTQKDTGTWIDLGNTSSQDKAVMKTAGGKTLSAPGALTSSTTFTNDWKACQ